MGRNQQKNMAMTINVCVCVCVRERERERELDNNLLMGTIRLPLNLPCQAGECHQHSTVVMIYPPAKVQKMIALEYVHL